MKKEKSRAKHFTEAQIQKFKNDPNVRDVSKNTIRFTYDFRILLYEAWEKEGRVGIKRVLAENGFDLKVIGSNCIGTLQNSFAEHGRPSNARYNQPVGSVRGTDQEDNEYLLSTGRFVRAKNGQGISFSEDFRNELFAAWPEQSVWDGIRKAGIDPVRVGYQRIHLLQREFKNGSPRIVKKAEYSAEFIDRYSSHPYIASITARQIRFSKPFFNEASFLIRNTGIDEILHLYEINPEDLTLSVRLNLKYRLLHWTGTEDRCEETTPQLVRIQHRRWEKLAELMNEQFRIIREEELPAMNHLQKKSLCLWIQGYPKDPEETVTVSWLLKKTGISRSDYYSILRSRNYGQKQQEKENQDEDEEDVKLVRKVMEYQGFRKGSRQIYMEMPDIVGCRFSLKKIRRLMKKYGLSSGIREKKQSRIEARKNLEEHRKPNILKRRFRIAPPNTHILTDVTYLPYGDGKLAYGSAIMDAVTARLYSLKISDCNDLELVMSSADDLNDVTLTEKAIFHSDQGSLYLTDTFQEKIRQLHLQQSMSKRGNCLDNAVQESFFGHFKDECDYRKCQSLAELQTLGSRYLNYWNTERRQWERNRMTPLEYENYLAGMSEEEFCRYLQKEEEKYQRMKERAAQKAQERAKTLGV